MKNFRVLIWGALAASATFALAGCGEVSSPSSPRQVLQTALQAREIGREFDAGQRAAQAGDIKGLTRSSDELRRLGATRQARYFSSDDPEVLNALGYSLADHGQSIEDFQTGEKLVRHALRLYGEILQAKPEIAQLPQIRFDRATIRDSLAWALFRQKKFDAAWSEQKNAVAEAQSAGAQLGLPATNESLVELLFHLKQIETALGRKPQAAPGAPPISPKPPPSPQDQTQKSPQTLPLRTA